jgi:hypothetical protein
MPLQAANKRRDAHGARAATRRRWMANVIHPIARMANVILLGAFTLCMAFLVGMMCTFWDVEVCVPG